jgi:diguanylate cyclase (GGDEF)-like protein/putative nucleotidyltransferase with HDIG domain
LGNPYLLSALEALAGAIDATESTPGHIPRLRLYAAGVARALGVADSDVEGIDIAAILHDIGKLAVPGHILSKPGPLTPDEIQQTRAHPKIGADILSAVPFPSVVAPLILSHHERWDGTGYPSGLKGEAIPLGARILSVVDYFDELMVERPYAKAMSVDTAIDLLQQEAGKGLDPTVVEIFLGIWPSLQKEARAIDEAAAARPDSRAFETIGQAHREISALYAIAKTMGTSLGVSDTMTLIAGKLNDLVPFSCAALFLYDEETETLRCRFATGTDAEIIQQVSVHTGEGLTGWVARNRRALVNARPGSDLEAAGVAELHTVLKSALACPLLFDDRLIGTLSVYHTGEAFYRDDHRRLLDHISEQAAAVINNSMRFEQTQEDSLRDPLTGLPNTGFLFMYLTRELARAERLKSELGLLVIHLDDLAGINRTHGHYAGDRALCEVARVLRSAIRPYDVAVRYKGREFIVVLSGCGATEVEQRRLEMKKTIDELYFETAPGKRLKLAINSGGAVFPRDGRTYEALLGMAGSRL